MSFRTNLLDKTFPAAGTAGAGRPLSAGMAILVWIVLMSALWLVVGAGAYVLIGTAT